MKKDNELIEFTNKTIAELVKPKWELQKAYNYYNGKRDAEQFRYLEENYGIGNPTSVEFIPLIRKHIDALVGEYLGVPIQPKATCKDSRTISRITREKELKIKKEVYDFLKNRYKNKILQSIQGNQQIVDKSIEHDLQELIDDLDSNFVSDFEQAAQNVIQYVMQSREADIITKHKMLLLDLLITGWTFYRAKQSSSGTNVVIEVLNPLNTFIDPNPESPYVKDSHRAVVRKWLTRQQVLNQYGDQLSKEDIATLKEAWRDTFDADSYYVRSFAYCDGRPSTDGIRAGKEIIPGYPVDTYHSHNFELIPVYEVEWVEADNNFVMQRYKTIRIGENIYILIGKDDNVIRTQDNPTQCTLSINGIYFTNRSSEPYSLVLACATLQDKYDLLHFYRDNLIASSGTVGDYIDLSVLPKFLGKDLPERLQKYIAYKKAGMALIDTSQDGGSLGSQTPMNTIYNGFDDTVKAQAIQAIQMAIDSIEQTASSITGVFRERLNGIQQRDAVTNVQTSVNNSFTITKQYYQQMDVLTEEMMLDILNVAKVVYKKGLTGTIILGDKLQKVFTALPEHFTLTDYDVHLTTSTDIIKDSEQLRALVPEFVKAQLLDPEVTVDIMTTRDLTGIKQRLRAALQKQKKENSQIQQLTQQNEQLQQQLQQANQELQKLQNKMQQYDERKLQLEQDKINKDYEVKKYAATATDQYQTEKNRIEDERTRLEIMQLNDGNPYNDTIRKS